MPGGSAQAKDIVSAAATASTVADIARLLRDLRRRYARQQRDSPLTYRELAAKTGWSQAAIAEYFSGRTLPPTDRLDALAVLLGATAAELSALGTARDRLEERRRAASPSAAVPLAGPPLPGGAVPTVRQLPRDVSGFAGRAEELARLDALLDQDGRLPAVVIATVSGMAGVGKTALAVHWAHRIAHRFPDGQLYINLRGFDPGGPPMASAEAVRWFLDALQVSPQRVPVELDAQAALYRSLLAGRKMLVLLDNARGADQIRPLLPGAAGCVVLVTSRDVLSGLVAADGAHPLTLDLLTRADAGDLLTERLGPDRIAAEPDAVERIITECAGLPLALAIVAARAATQHQLPLAALAGELQDRHDRLDALSTGDATTDVRVVFSCSYHTLTLDAAWLFRLLGLHPGPDISAPAAASLAGVPLPQVLPLLAELTRANLLVEHTVGRYTLHDLLRTYATRLTHTTDPDRQRHAATHRMLDHYLHTAHTAARLLAPARDPITLDPAGPGVTPEQPADHAQALAWFAAEHSVLLTAVEHAAVSGLDTHAGQLAWTLADFLCRRGHWHDLAATQRAAIATAERLANPTTQARAHQSLAVAYLQLGRFNDAHTQLRHALELHRQAHDPVGQAHAHRALAHVWERQDRHVEALDHARRALDLYQAGGHRRGQGLGLNAIGWYHARLGDHQQALTYCRDALTRLQELGDYFGQANAWDSLGYAHHQLGHHTQAIACYQRAVDLLRDLGDRYNEATIVTRLGEACYAANDPHTANDAWQHALTILTDLDHPDADHVRTKLAGLDVK